MKKYLIFFAICSIFITCNSDRDEPEVIPEIPEEPEVPCRGCCDIELVEGYSVYHEVVWNYCPFDTPRPAGEDWIDYCQIPDDILNSLTTKELTEICIQNPFGMYFSCVEAYVAPAPHCNTCIDDIIGRFNGLTELFKREDCLYELLKRYDEVVILMDTSNISVICSVWVNVIYLFSDIEMLLGRYQTDNDDAVETYKEILRHLIDGYQVRLKYPDIFNNSRHILGNLIARMNIIDKISPGTIRDRIGPTWYGDTIPCYACYNLDERNIIDELSYELIK